MTLKTVSFALGLLATSSGSVVAEEDYADLCGSNIEGVNLSMPKAEVQLTLASGGYEKTSDSDDSKKKKKNRPESIQSLLFQTEDRQPNADFIRSVSWKRTLATGRNTIYATYVAPTDPARLKTYEAFWRSKITDYCMHEIDTLRATSSTSSVSKVSRMTPNSMSPMHEFCENALQGVFRTNGIGHAQTPPDALHITDAQGCRAFYRNVNLRGFTSSFIIGIEHTR